MKSKAALFDFFGSFADTAILLPILSLLATNSGYRIEILLLTAGLLYLVSGWLFRVPISVQPLKSIAIASIALGASATEIRLSGLILGMVFLGLFFTQIKTLPIPEVVVRAVQLGLGVLLILQSFKMIPHTPFAMVFSGLASSLILFLDFKRGIQILGALALGVFILALCKSGVQISLSFPTPEAQVRWPLILSLLIPQLALTASNSILGAKLACDHYFKASAHRVTPSRLMLSVGLGNILMSAVNGLPFCHGAGGITAHVRGGATTVRMNYFIGGFLMLLSLLSVMTHPDLSLGGMGSGIVLFCVGVFHLDLARPALKLAGGPLILCISFLATLLTSNLIYAFLFAILIHLAFLLKSWRPARD